MEGGGQRLQPPSRLHLSVVCVIDSDHPWIDHHHAGMLTPVRPGRERLRVIRDLRPPAGRSDVGGTSYLTPARAIVRTHDRPCTRSLGRSRRTMEPDGPRGTASITMVRRGILNGAARSRTHDVDPVTARRVGGVGGHHVGHHLLAPRGMGPARDRNVGDSGAGAHRPRPPRATPSRLRFGWPRPRAPTPRGARHRRTRPGRGSGTSPGRRIHRRWRPDRPGTRRRAWVREPRSPESGPVAIRTCVPVNGPPS